MKGKLLFIILFVLLIGCTRGPKQLTWEQALKYFPLEPGRTFRYKITIRESQPYFYQFIKWALPDGREVGGGHAQYSRPFLEDLPVQNPYYLEMRVLGRVADLPYAKLRLSNVVKVDIVQDDLELYSLYEALYFGEDASAQAISEVGVLPEKYSQKPYITEAVVGRAYTMRPIFCAPRKNVYLEASEKYHYFQFEDWEAKQMHCLRAIDVKQDPEFSEAVKTKIFAEHFYYKKGEGLVTMVQFLDDKVSMIWELEE